MNALCRHCGSEAIASYDRYVGTCVGTVEIAADEFEYVFVPGGWTDINWDSCEQLGWQCTDCFSTEEALLEDGVRDLDAALKRLTKGEA